MLNDAKFWLKVIKFIIELILEGNSKKEAVRLASIKFGISEEKIWEHGGF